MASSSSTSGWDLRNDQRAIDFSLLPNRVPAIDTDQKRMSSSSSSTSTTSTTRLYDWERINEFAQMLFFNRYSDDQTLLLEGLNKIRAEYSLLDNLLDDLPQNPGQSRCPYELTTMALVAFMRSVEGYNNRYEYPRRQNLEAPFYELNMRDAKIVKETLRQAVEIPIQLLHHAVINIFRNNFATAQKYPALNAIMYCFEFIYYNLRYKLDRIDRPDSSPLRSFDEIVLKMSFEADPPLSFDEAVSRVLFFQGIRHSPDPQYFLHVGTLVRIFAECLPPREAFLLSSANDWSVCDRDAALAIRAYQKGMDAEFYHYADYFGGLPAPLRELVEAVPENSLTELWSHLLRPNKTLYYIAAAMRNIPDDLLFIVMTYLHSSPMRLPLTFLSVFSLEEYTLEEYTQPLPLEGYTRIFQEAMQEEDLFLLSGEAKWDSRLDSFAQDLIQIKKEFFSGSRSYRLDLMYETGVLENRFYSSLGGEDVYVANGRRSNQNASSPYQINSALLDLVGKHMEMKDGDTSLLEGLFANCQSPFFQYDNILERAYQRQWDFNPAHIKNRFVHILDALSASIESCLQENKQYLGYYPKIQRVLMEMSQTLREKIQTFNSELKDSSREPSMLKQKLKRFIPEMMAIVYEDIQKVIESPMGINIGAALFRISNENPHIKQRILDLCRDTMRDLGDLIGTELYNEFYPHQFVDKHPGVKLKGGM